MSFVVDRLTDDQTQEQYRSITSPGTDDSRNISLSYLVDTGDRDVTEREVLLDVGLPARGDVHPDHEGFFCTSRRAMRHRDNRMLWTVRVTYESFSGTPPVYDYPWDEPPQVRIATVELGEVVVEKAYQTGDTIGTPTQPVVDAAKQPFLPSITGPDSCLQVTITENRTEFETWWIRDYHNTVNREPFTLVDLPVAAKQARMMAIDFTRLFYEDGDGTSIPYYQVTFVIRLRLDKAKGWTLVVANRGFKVMAGGGAVEITLPDPVTGKEKPVTEPMWLKADGTDWIRPADFALYNYLDYNQFFVVSWAPLSLPEAIDVL